MLLSTYPTLCCKEIGVSPNIRVLLSGTLSHTPYLETISPRQLGRVVNKTRRRRRRSSLLTTAIRQSTSRGCLPHVGQQQSSNYVVSSTVVVNLLFHWRRQLLGIWGRTCLDFQQSIFYASLCSYHHHHQFNTHACSMNKNKHTHNNTHEIIQKDIIVTKLI